MRDAFGQWVGMERYADRKDDKHRSRSILAAVAQSWEMKIMLSILPVIQRHERLQMVGWLHDGVILNFGDRSRAGQFKAELKTAVKRRLDDICNETGYRFQTYMDIKQLPKVSATVNLESAPMRLAA
jgi:hypothetical protein